MLLQPLSKLQAPRALVHFVVARLAESSQVPSGELVLRVEASVQYVVNSKLLAASTQDAAALFSYMLAS